MAIWTPPETNWQPEDNISTAKLNAIGNNLLYLKEAITEIITDPVTEVNYTGLDFVNTIYTLDIVLYNAYAGTTNFYLFCNGDETLTNYYQQGFRVHLNTHDIWRTNTPVIDDVLTGHTLSVEIKCTQPYARATPGSPRFKIEIEKEVPALVEFKRRSLSWTGTAPVTSIKVKASNANAIGAGSKFRLWR